MNIKVMTNGMATKAAPQVRPVASPGTASVRMVDLNAVDERSVRKGQTAGKARKDSGGITVRLIGWMALGALIVLGAVAATTNAPQRITITSGSSSTLSTLYTTSQKFLQITNVPTAAEINPAASGTNYILRNVNGQLKTWWSDGTNLYTKVLAP